MPQGKKRNVTIVNAFIGHCDIFLDYSGDFVILITGLFSMMSILKLQICHQKF